MLVTFKSKSKQFPSTWEQQRGAVLLEVILALVLFVAAAAVISSALNASLDGVERQKLKTHAVNLALSVLSELQMGLRTTESTGPEPFESPFENWTWQLALTPQEDEVGETSGLTQVEVIIRHDEPALVYRLAQVLKLEAPKAAKQVASNGSSF